jgi:UDP-N-acetylmuramate--alanine ligase
MKIHFVGIGGIGISGVAQFCKERGDIISGSDITESEIFPALEKAGITVSIPQKAENVPEDCDLVVYTEAVDENNPERVFSKEKGLREMSYFKFLGELSSEFHTIAVTGTHGKTTTCGMIAAGMKGAQFDPTFFVGSTLSEFNGSNFHLGTNDWMVCEACEYRNNFQYLKPQIVVLTNVEWDHPDSYPTEESYFKAFQDFVADAKLVIYHRGDEGAERALEKFKGEKLSIPSQSPNSWEQILKIKGQHNYDNATLALALAHKLELKLEPFKKGLGKFTGAGRRQEHLTTIEGIHIYDDYGHHPTEIRATLSGLREKYPEAKIGLIYEPHQFSRTKTFFPEFVEALRLADYTALFPIYEARDSEEDKKFGVENFITAESSFSFVQTKEEALEFQKNLHEGDILLFMGAGKISAFARSFLVR